MNKLQISRFLLGRFLAAIGDQFLMFSAPLIIYQATGSVAKSGLAFFIEWTPRILTLPIAGLFADRFSHKSLYVTTDISRAIICLLGYLALKINLADPFVVISFMMGLLSIFNSVSFITIEATLPRLFSASDLPKAQSFLQGLDQLSQVAGPALAALFLSFVDRSSLIGFAAIGFLVSGLNIFIIGPLLSVNSVNSPLSVRDFFNKLKFGFNIFISKQELIILSILACMVNLIMGTTLAQVAPLVTGTFGKSDQFFGGMTTLAAILSILTFTQIPKLAMRLSMRRLGIWSLISLVLAGLLLAKAPRIEVFVLGYALMICGCAIFNIFMRTWRAQIIPKEHLGKVIGILVLINNSTLPLSGVLVAAYSSKFGSQGLILFATVVMFFIATFATLKLKENAS